MGSRITVDKQNTCSELVLRARERESPAKPITENACIISVTLPTQVPKEVRLHVFLHYWQKTIPHGRWSHPRGKGSGIDCVSEAGRPSFTWMLVRISDFTFAERSEHRLLLSIYKDFGLRIFSQCSRYRILNRVVFLAPISQVSFAEVVKFNFKVYRVGHSFMGPRVCQLFILTTIWFFGARIFFSSKFILRSANLL